jgi:hypothetical protein
MKDLGFREKVIGKFVDPFPCEFVLLTTSPQRAQPEALHVVVDGAECPIVGWHGMIGKDAPDDLRQPTSLFGDWLVHPISQPLLDFFELHLRAITSAPPMEEELTPPRLTADEGEP